MISYLKGKVVIENPKYATILVGGVGYRVEVPRMISRLDNDEDVELFIHTHVREDSFRLFGFNTEAELNLFEELLTVSGVGPKGALAIVASDDISNIVSDIVTGDIVKSKISGVGKKTLEKLVIELQTKMSKIEGDSGRAKTHARKFSSVKTDNISQANLALQSLGFKSGEVEDILDQIEDIKDMELNLIIKTALKKMR